MNIRYLPPQDAAEQVMYDVGKSFKFAQARDGLIAHFAKAGITPRKLGAPESDGLHLRMMLTKPPAGAIAHIVFSVVYSKGDEAVSIPVAELTQSADATYAKLNSGSGVFPVLEDAMKNMGATVAHDDPSTATASHNKTRVEELRAGAARAAFDDSIRDREFDVLRSIKRRAEAKLREKPKSQEKPLEWKRRLGPESQYEPVSHQFEKLMERLEGPRVDTGAEEKPSSGAGKNPLGELPEHYMDNLREHSLHELELELVQKVLHSFGKGTAEAPKQQVQTADEIRFLTLYVLNRRFDEALGKTSDTPKR